MENIFLLLEIFPQKKSWNFFVSWIFQTKRNKFLSRFPLKMLGKAKVNYECENILWDQKHLQTELKQKSLRKACSWQLFAQLSPSISSNINIERTVSSWKNFAKKRNCFFLKTFKIRFISLFKVETWRKTKTSYETFLLPSVQTFFITQLKKFHCAVSRFCSTSYIFCDSNFFTNFFFINRFWSCQLSTVFQHLYCAKILSYKDFDYICFSQCGIFFNLTRELRKNQGKVGLC